MFKAVLFDLDGTLVDTEKFIHGAFNFALQSYGYRKITRHKLAGYAGIKLHELYEILAPNEDAEKLIEAHRRFQKKNQQLVKKYPKTVSVLKKLRKNKVKIGIVTGRYRKSAETTMEKTGMKKLADVFVCGDDFAESKPSPKPYLAAIEKLGLQAKECLVVGDGCSDIVSGKMAGCVTCRAMYGYGAIQRCREKADMKINKLEEVFDCIRQKK